eukprot:scaffold5_cov169-Amphora_coffeaeformis.AAC.18
MDRNKLRSSAKNVKNWCESVLHEQNAEETIGSFCSRLLTTNHAATTLLSIIIKKKKSTVPYCVVEVFIRAVVIRGV